MKCEYLKLGIKIYLISIIIIELLFSFQLKFELLIVLH